MDRSLAVIPRAIRVAAASVLTLVVTALATPAWAADAASALKVVAVDNKSAPDVKVTVAVPRELLGTALPDSAFTIVEAGRKRLAHITRLPSDELAVVLAIDTSGSMQGAPLAAAKSAATSFIQQMPANTRVGLVSFSDTASVVSPFTSDVAALTSSIDGLRAQGETSLYDAVVAAASELGTSGTARRDLVVLTDGRDTASRTALDAAAAAVTSAEAIFYPVSLVTSETDLPTLNQLATLSGGTVVEASNPAALGALYDSIAQEITSQYEVSFKATHAGPTDVTISVASGTVRASTELTVDLPAVPTTAPAASRVAAPVTVATPVLGGQDWALIVGGILVAAAIIILLVMLAGSRQPQSTLATERRDMEASTRPHRVSDLVESASRLADRTLEQRGQRSALNDALERAGIDMRTGEFSVLVGSVALAALFFGLLLFGPIVGILLAILTFVVFRTAVENRARRRRAQFADQLGDTLQLLAGNLRAGHGLLQSVDTIADESESPTREEFRRVVIETRLGQNLTAALHAAAARVRNADFEWVVQAIDIHRNVGGDLAEILDRVADTIRDRNSIRRQVQALSAEGRLSAVILFVLPILLTIVIAIVNPGYLSELTDTTEGHVLIALGVSLMLVGGVWLRRVSRVVF